MAIIKKSTNSKCWRGCGEKGMLLHCWWECKLIQPLWKTVWRVLKKARDKATIWSSNPTHRHVPWGNQLDTCFPLFIAALFTIARTWKQPRCPSTDEWIKNLWYINTMNNSVIKRSTFESVLMRWMNLAPIIQSEVRKRNRNIIF